MQMSDSRLLQNHNSILLEKCTIFPFILPFIISVDKLLGCKIVFFAAKNDYFKSMYSLEPKLAIFDTNPVKHDSH